MPKLIHPRVLSYAAVLPLAVATAYAQLTPNLFPYIHPQIESFADAYGTFVCAEIAADGHVRALAASTLISCRNPTRTEAIEPNVLFIGELELRRGTPQLREYITNTGLALAVEQTGSAVTRLTITQPRSLLDNPDAEDDEIDPNLADILIELLIPSQRTGSPEWYRIQSGTNASQMFIYPLVTLQYGMPGGRLTQIDIQPVSKPVAR